jgi:hypothetical protein
MFFVARNYTAYMDESCSEGLLMCVGGWLAHDITWEQVENRWDGRIRYENSRSVKRGEPKIDRYHASDLDNLKAQFRPENGWDRPRGIQFTKKLIDALSKGRQSLSKPIGICSGIFIPHMQEAFPGSRNEKIFKQHWAAYRVCMIESLLTLAETMRRAFPREQVAVVYDRGPYSSAAQSAFNSFKEGKTVNKDDIVTMAPMGWENCTALQPADLMVYEGRKLIKSGIRDRNHFRRSLQRIIGKGNMIRVRYIGREALLSISASRKLAPPLPPDFVEETN